MSIWLKKWFVTGISFILMSASFAVTSASSVELTRAPENDSYLNSQSTSSDLLEDTPSDNISYIREAMGSLFVLAKSGVKAVRKNPLKALTIFLALQNKNSSYTMPSAEAALVSNVNQNLTYEIDGPPVHLLPITNFTTAFPCNATIVLGDINSGNLTSTGSGLTQTFSAGVWNANGNLPGLISLLSNLIFTPAQGYRQTIYLYPTIIDTMFKDTIQGTIQITPTPTSLPSTSQMTQSPTTKNPTTTMSPTILITPTITTKNTAASTTNRAGTSAPTSSSMVGSEGSTSHQELSGGPVTSFSSATLQESSMLQTGTTSSISNNTAQIPLVAPESEPPYAIIGGALGGGILLTGVIALFVAGKRGWCGMGTQPRPQEQDPEVGNVYDKVGGLQPGGEYDKVVLPGDGYQGLPVSAIKNVYELPEQGFPNYGIVPVSAQKAQYDACEQPFS